MNGAIKKIIFFSLITCTPFLAFANTGGDDDCENETVETCEEQDVKLPKVFLIGEYPEEFDLASAEYNLQLLDACNQNMDRAYYKWQSMLIEMEDYAEALGFEIKGVKMWIKVFWAANGKIDHIAYHLKPKSRNVDQNRLTAFLMNFMDKYEFPLIADEKFSNYSIANFPTVFVRNNDDNNKLDSLEIAPRNESGGIGVGGDTITPVGAAGTSSGTPAGE